MRIHFIAIGGSVMHNLAVWLHKQGEEVSGSDDKIFGPAKDALSAHGLLPGSIGWDPERITPSIDVVILGMHARADNPELLRAQALGLRVQSFPAFVYDRCAQKQRIVICGSHGKSTISAMILHVLKKAGKPADYVIGAPFEGLEGTVRLTEESPLVVLEGDEYPSSAIDRQPKFLHYHHHIAVVSGIAWDHANIYADEASYREVFEQLVERTPKAGMLAYHEADKLLANVVKRVDMRKDIFLQAYNKYPAKIKDGVTYLKTNQKSELPLKVFGDHNLQNISAAWEVCHQLGIAEGQFLEAVASFKGAKFRMELLAKSDQVQVFRDFAHAPSKVKATVDALAAQFKGQKVCACLELHTFSSLDPKFIGQYRKSMAQADMALVYYDPAVVAAKKLPPLSAAAVVAAFGRDDLQVFTDRDELASFLYNQEWDGTVLALMSSGSFNNLDLEELAGKIAQQQMPM